MTREEIRNTPAAAVSSNPDTDTMCGWLREIALQMALMNEQLQLLSFRQLMWQSPSLPEDHLKPIDPPQYSGTTTYDPGSTNETALRQAETDLDVPF